MLLNVCDFIKEALHQQILVDRFAGYPDLKIPKVRHDLCRQHVLVTEFIIISPEIVWKSMI